MDLSVKAYLRKDNKFEKCEIRRFGLENQSAKSYQHLVERIVAVFPSLNQGMFTTAWKDDEDEMITFSTDEEYEIALQNMQEDQLFRVYIKEKSEEGNNEEQPKPMHIGAKRKFRCSNHCLEVEEEPVYDGFGRLLCSQCFNSAYLPYECKKCNHIQYIKYNLNPDNTWYCHNNCQTWTHWKLPDDTKK